MFVAGIPLEFLICCVRPLVLWIKAAEGAEQLKCGGGAGGGGKTIEMWRWWYIASLFTKQC